MRFKSSSQWLAASVLLIAAGASTSARALEYRSVEAAAAVLYDTPSAKGKKLYVVRRLTPVELVVNLEGWAKVRDADGTLAWIEKKALGERRTVIVVAARAEVRSNSDPSSPMVFEAERGVALDVADTPREGWVKVSHADGQSGFVRTNQVWGL